MGHEKKTDRTLQNKKLLGIVLVLAAVAVLAATVILYFTEKHSKEEAETANVYGDLISQYYESILSEDGEAMYQLLAPEAYWSYVQEQYGETREEQIAAYDTTAAQIADQWRGLYGDDVKASFTINSLEEQSQEAIEELNETLQETGCAAEQAVVLTVMQTLSGSAGKAETMIQPTMILVDGQWYLIDPAVAEEKEETT